MNAIRRKKLSKINELLTDAYTMLEEVKDEENECFENIPENLQGSERYDKAEEIVGYLEEAYDNLDEVIRSIDEAIEA